MTTKKSKGSKKKLMVKKSHIAALAGTAGGTSLLPPTSGENRSLGTTSTHTPVHPISKSPSSGKISLPF